MTNVRATWWLCVGVLCAAPATAAAQPLEPISRFVIDARGSFAGFPDEGGVASALDVTTDNLPTRGFGVGIGLHWYPLRRRLVSFGLGGELLIARDERTAESTGTTTTALPTVATRFSAFSPQISINFGKRDGWSYLSGGVGRARMTTEREDVPVAGGADRTQAINYGAGARWFTGPHLAFSVDVRWYAVNARPATITDSGYPRTRLMVISAGISLH